MKGHAIVKAVMAEFKLGEADFFKSQLTQHVAARRVAIKRLHAAGLNLSEMGHAMKRDPTTIRYWVSREFRERKKRTRLARLAELKTEQAA